VLPSYSWELTPSHPYLYDELTKLSPGSREVEREGESTCIEPVRVFECGKLVLNLESPRRASGSLSLLIFASPIYRSTETL